MMMEQKTDEKVELKNESGIPGIVLYPGTRSNPNREFLESLMERIDNNFGYCPSRMNVSTKNMEDYKCPCLPYRTQGKCKCSRFIKLKTKQMRSFLNDSVEIESSLELREWNLTGMIGMKGIVTEEDIDPKTKNKWVNVRLIGEKFEGEFDWYVPISALKIIPRNKISDKQ